MAKKHSGKRGRRAPKTVLRLPDLDQALISHSPGGSSLGARHHQSAPWGSSPTRLRGGRLRTVES